MTFAELALLAIAATSQVWVTTDGLTPSGADPNACSGAALAAAVRAQRPGATVRAWQPQNGERPPDGAVQARLSQDAGGVKLDVRGGGVSVSRALSATDPCERNVATSALIVDGALDQLEAPTSAPTVDSLAPPIAIYKQLHVSLAVGGGTEQGLARFVPAFAAEAAVRYRLVRLTVDVDVALASQEAFKVLPPEGQVTGDLSSSAIDAELGLGVAPRLGPGRLEADVALGVSVTRASASATSTGALFGQAPTTATEPFGGLRLGYALDLPRSLYLGVRAEERLARRASFEVVGAGFNGSSTQGPVTTSLLSFGALAFIGIHFF